MTKPKPQPELFGGGSPPSDYGAGKDHGAEKHVPPLKEGKVRLGGRRNPKPAPRPAPPAPVKPSQAVAVVEPQPEVNLLSMIGQAITSQTVDGDKLTKLVDWYDRRNADNAYARDFLAMAKELPAIKQDGTIDQGTTRSGRQGVKSKYATYRNIHEVTSPILHRHGFTLSSYNTVVGQQVMLVLRLEHYDQRFGSSARESIRPIVSDESGGKTTVQAIESGAQYFLRRMVIKLLNLRSAAPEDDDRDGNPPKVTQTESVAAAAARVPISKAQVEKLQAAIVRCGVPLDKFKAWAEQRGVVIDKVELLPADLFEPALKACDKYEADNRGKK